MIKLPIDALIDEGLSDAFLRIISWVVPQASGVFLTVYGC
jgi:hypothetical protein